MRGVSYVLALAGVTVAGVAVTPQAHAQDSDYRIVDRIAAVVGRVPIPESRVEERLQQLRVGNPEMPTDSAALSEIRRDILDSLVVEELVVQAAERDTMVSVGEEDVQARADEQLRTVRAEFPSELDFQRQIRASGFATVDEYRLWLVRDFRRRMMQDGLFDLLRAKGELRPVQPTEAELRVVYEQAVEMSRQVEPRPPTVSFRQIIVKAEPDSVALLEAFTLADSVMSRARAGEDFAALAAEFSDDPGSAERGGDLPWFRRGAGYAKEFERVSFNMRPGQISAPVRTSFGFHIIQVMRAEPAEVHTRHILIVPDVGEAQFAEARARADTVAQKLRNGAALDSILRKYHDPDEMSFAERVDFQRLPQDYQDAINAASPGDVIGPLVLAGSSSDKYAILLFQERLAEGEYTFEELRDRLREQVAEQNGIARYVEELRKSAFIEIRL